MTNNKLYLHTTDTDYLLSIARKTELYITPILPIQTRNFMWEHDDSNIHLFVIDSFEGGIPLQLFESLVNPDKHTILQIVPKGISEEIVELYKLLTPIVQKHKGHLIIDNDITKSAELINSICRIW